MKKYILMILVAFQFANATEKDSISGKNPFKEYYNYVLPAMAKCDACGCSASGGSMGFASMLNSNFIGIRYFNQHYKSSDGLYSNSPWYSESFNTVQIWARIPVYKNVQISALLPYHFHSRETATGNQDIKGLGDITVLAMYRLYQTHKDSTFLVHTLQVGGGVKAPTGKFDEANAGNVNPSFQVGTGSWDYILATEYIVKRKRFGLNTMLNYVYKTENDKQYRFGNQFNYSGTFFYLYENKKKFSLAPQLGFAGEVYGSNHQYSEVVRKTSGDIFFGKFGVEVGKKKFSFGTNVMLPINQNLSSGRVEANYRWSVNLNYSL
jgi:hypothetical protein